MGSVTVQLRPYQEAAIAAVWGWWAANRQHEPLLICAPTGSGKTIIFAELCRRMLDKYPGVSILVLAHRKELIEQTESKLLQIWPQAPVGVYAASVNRRETAQITIASRDTVANIIEDLGQFTFLIIDEAHRVSMKEEGRYRTIIAKLKEKYEHLVVIGFTATPYRLGQGLIYGKGKLFADMAYQIGMRTLIDAGNLVDYRFPHVEQRAVINTDGVATIGGDFDEDELSERATAEGMVEAAIDNWQTHAADRLSSVFFCVSILHAQMIAEELLRRGIDCPVVTGSTPKTERSEALRRFADGEFRAITNVGVLTEGWDCPRCDCIVLLRPTKSASLYVQMVGRGLRTFDGKQDCLVMDFGGNVERLGKPEDATEPEPVKRSAPQRGENESFKRCGQWFEATDGSEGGWRNGCGCKNHPAAAQCVDCGKPFFEHAIKAYSTDAQGRRLQSFDVDSVQAMVCTSRNSGKDYVRVAYNCGLLQTFYKNIMLGYDGYAGEKAIGEWAQITGQNRDVIRSDLECLDLRSMVSETSDFAKVNRITVDLASKWKDITNVEYSC